MIYAKLLNGQINQYPAYPIQEHPNTSFPVDWIGGIVENDEYCTITPLDFPAFDSTTQKISEGTPEQINGIWTQTWIITNLSENELLSRKQLLRESMIVSPLQANAALAHFNLLDSVETLINNSPDVLVKLSWNKAIQFKRLSPMVLSIAEQLNWTDAQLDDLFIYAATIKI